MLLKQGCVSTLCRATPLLRFSVGSNTPPGDRKGATMTARPRADESRTVAIAGANGMVGRHLVEALHASGDRVIALVRQPSAHHFSSAVEIRRWQASDPVAPVDGADAVVNLVGDPIFAKAWSPARKQELTQTRRLATRSLVEGIRKVGGEGRTFVSSTAVEYAGDTGDRQVDENAAAGNGGFLAELAQQWEAEAHRVCETGARLVLLPEPGVGARRRNISRAAPRVSQGIWRHAWSWGTMGFLGSYQ